MLPGQHYYFTSWTKITENLTAKLLLLHKKILAKTSVHDLPWEYQAQVHTYNQPLLNHCYEVPQGFIWDKSSVHGILQESILEWVAVSFFRGPFPPRDQTQISHIADRFFITWAVREAPEDEDASSNSMFLRPALFWEGIQAESMVSGAFIIHRSSTRWGARTQWLGLGWDLLFFRDLLWKDSLPTQEIHW